MGVFLTAVEGKQVWEERGLKRVGCTQVVKQQQMKENARLRATMEEWSHRNVKCALCF